MLHLDESQSSWWILFGGRHQFWLDGPPCVGFYTVQFRDSVDKNLVCMDVGLMLATLGL